MNSKLECSEPITFNVNGCDETGIQFLWDLYFERIKHDECMNDEFGIKNEVRNIAIRGNYISESVHNKLKPNSEYPPGSDTSPDRMRRIHATLTSHMLEYLYKQCKEQAKTIELLTERMSKQDELIEEQRVNLELYINGEEVIVLKKGVFKAK
jgi:hypothetical protein